MAPAPTKGATGGGSASSNIVTEQALNDARFFTLQWSDPLNTSGNDYDLFLLDAGLTMVVAGSTDIQDGDDDPFEDIDSQGINDSGRRLVITKEAAADARFVHLNTHRAMLQFGTDGQIFGHPGAASAFAVAATNVSNAAGPGGTFNGTEVVETFSSDGPRRIFFDAGGSPVSFQLPPFIPKGGQTSIVRQKPDICAADGVSTATPGFNPFFGTSASAPHAAGISALLLDLWPSISRDGAFGLFNSSALDIEDFGFDRDSGAGILDANTAIDNTIFADGFESGDTAAWTSSVD